jgi:hypothetical protein
MSNVFFGKLQKSSQKKLSVILKPFSADFHEKPVRGLRSVQTVVFITNFVYGTPEKACLPSAASRSLSPFSWSNATKLKVGGAHLSAADGWACSLSRRKQLRPPASAARLRQAGSLVAREGLGHECSR